MSSLTNKRLSYRQLLLLAIALVLLAHLLIGLFFYRQMTNPSPKFFATTLDGQMVEIVPGAAISPQGLGNK